MSQGFDLNAVREGATKIHEYRTCTPGCLAELTALRKLEMGTRRLSNCRTAGGEIAAFEMIEAAHAELDAMAVENE